VAAALTFAFLYFFRIKYTCNWYNN